MSEFFFESLENVDQLWRLYWALGIVVWVLVWLGIRRMMWWGFSSVILGITAGLIFTLARGETGELAPATMLTALNVLSKSAESSAYYLSLIAVVSVGVTGVLIMAHVAFLKTGRLKDSKTVDLKTAE